MYVCGWAQTVLEPVFRQWDNEAIFRRELNLISDALSAAKLEDAFADEVADDLMTELQARRSVFDQTDNAIQEALRHGKIPVLQLAIDENRAHASPALTEAAEKTLKMLEANEEFYRRNQALSGAPHEPGELREAIKKYSSGASADVVQQATRRLHLRHNRARHEMRSRRTNRVPKRSGFLMRRTQMRATLTSSIMQA